MSMQENSSNARSLSIGQVLALGIAILVSVFGLVVAAAYLVINVRVILARAGVEFAGMSKMDASGYLAALEAHIGSWSLNEYFSQHLANLEKMSLDLSAITPALLVWFFAIITWNIYRGLCHKISTTTLIDQAHNLPFFPRYQVMFVQFGLIATLYAFLQIGASMREVVDFSQTESGLNILLSSFGTALLSTFTGVTLAYGFGPVITYFWRICFRIPPQKEALASVVDELSGNLLRTNTEVVQFTQELTTVNEKLQQIVESLSSTKLEKLNQSLTGIEANTKRNGDRLQAIESALNGEKGLLAAVNSGQQDIVQCLRDLQATANERKEKLDGAQKILIEVSNKSDTTARDCKMLRAQIATLDEDSKARAHHISEVVVQVGGAVNTGNSLVSRGLRILIGSVRELKPLMEAVLERRAVAAPPVIVRKPTKTRLRWWPLGRNQRNSL